MNFNKLLAIFLSVTTALTPVMSVYAYDTEDENGRLEQADQTILEEYEVPKTAASSGMCGEDLVWSLDDEGTLKISGTGRMTEFASESSAPWYSSSSKIKTVIIEENVENISDFAFYGCDNLTDVTVNNGVVDIGNYAFAYCQNLLSFTLPDTLKTIGEEAFVSCESITSVIIPDSVVTIGNYCFDYCSAVTEIYIGNSVTEIGEGAFFECVEITSLTIPDSVTNIGAFAFCDCFVLKTLNLGKGIENIGESAFGACEELTDVYYRGTEDKWEKVTVGADNKPIENANMHFCSHEYCDWITDVELTCEADGKRHKICSLCDDVVTETIPTTGHLYGDWTANASGGYEKICSRCNDKKTCSAIVIDSGTCGSGVKWTFDTAGTLTISGTGKMTDYSSAGAPWYSDSADVKQIIVENGVKSIGFYAFEGCVNLTSVIIADSVSSIGVWAFYGCSGLEFAVLPNNITNIGYSAFRDCSSLKEIILPDGIVSIDNSAFYGCQALTSVVIPDSVTTIGTWAFAECSSLASVVIPDGVESIGDYAFYNCSGLLSVTIPDSVTSIGNDVFRGCKALASVTIPEGVTNIGDRAFYECSSLTSVVIPEGVTNIGSWAFAECSDLTAVTVPGSVTSIGKKAFSGSSSLADIYYTGSEDDWANISMGANNDAVLNATVHYEAEVCTHSYSEWVITVAPGCTSNGEKEKTCGNCGDVVKETVPAVGHSMKEKVVLPTCTANGYTAHYCENCTYTYNDTYVDIKDHSYGDWYTSKDVTCTENGENKRVCSVCGYEAVKVIPCNGHSMKESVYAPTCTEQGYTHHYCENCTYSYDDTYVDALGHSYGDWVKNSFGKYERICDVCKETEVEIAPVIAFGTCGENVTWTLDIKGKLVISGTGDMTDYASSSDVPWCNKYSMIEKAEIKDGVTGIGALALSECTGLTAVIIPASVVSINENAFAHCSALEEVCYRGNEEEWGNISIDSGNDALLNAVNIKLGYTDPVAVGITVAVINKSVYTYGEEFALDGIKVNMIYSDGSSDIAFDYTVTGYDKFTFGLQTLTVTLGDFVCECCVRVKPAEPNTFTSPIAAGTTVAEFAKAYSEQYTVFVFDNDKATQLQNNDTIKTGCIVQVINNNEVVDGDIIIVGGDVTADGIVNGKDLIRIKKQILEGGAVEYPEYADINCDGTVDENDLSALTAMM